MYALEIACSSGEREWLVAELWQRGTLGVIEHEERLTAYFADEAAVQAAATALATYRPRVSHVPERAWEESWREVWRPIPVGERFFLAPEWSREPTPPGRIRLLLRPGRACGTGLHPCTQLCLELLEEISPQGRTVLDVGTGTGLLAAAARRLGAARVIACDISEDAVAEATDRFRREAPDVLLFQGSLRALPSRVADLVLVNISAAAILELAPEIRRVLRVPGAAVLSGFRCRKLPDVSAALEAMGFRARCMRDREGWQAMLCYTP